MDKKNNEEQYRTKNDDTKKKAATSYADQNAGNGIDKQKSSNTMPSSPKEVILGTKDQDASMESATNSYRAKSPLTATVIIAAPFVGDQSDHTLAITGEDKNLGNWKHPHGKFETIAVISEQLHIFKGIVPIPLMNGSPFKFVHVKNQKMEYEGDGKKENRWEEILPHSWNFFVFKPKSKNILQQLWKTAMEFLSKPKTKEEIACKFVNILFVHTLEKILPEWDDAFEFLDDGLQKISHTVGEGLIIDGFRHLFNEWIQEPELQINFDRLFLLIVGACKMKVYSENIKVEVLETKSKEFSLYLHNLSHLKRKNQDLLDVFELVAKLGGNNFWWIFFRINRHSEGLAKYQNCDVSRSILKTLGEIPEVLLNNKEHATRVVDYLVRCNDIDKLYDNLRPIFDKNVEYQPLLDPLLLQHFLRHKTTVNDWNKIIRSKFVAKAFQTAANKENFVESAKIIFNNRNLLDVIRLAVDTPDYLLPIVKPIVESNVSQNLEKVTTFTKEEYSFFVSRLKSDSFNNFPQEKQKIEDIMLNTAIDSVKLGSFQNVKSVKLILLALAKIKIPFLACPEIVDLQKAIGSLPPKFFQNLWVVLNIPGVSLDKSLKPYRKGKTRAITIQVENHFDHLDELLMRIRNRQIPLNEFPMLKDPRVLDLLRSLGLTGQNQAELYQEVEELRERYKLYGSLYSEFSHSTIPANNQEDDEDTESIQILDSKEWEKYLNDINSEKSVLTLKDAMELQLPLELTSARWLFEIKQNIFFLKVVWHSMIKSLQNYPLSNKDLQELMFVCATAWKELAHTVAHGTVSFEKMDKIIRLQPDPELLSRSHLQSQPIEGVPTAYRNFKNLQELRQLIGPFVAALRLFSIKKREQIDNLYDFVENNLLKNWDSMTLKQVEKEGILRVMNEDLQFDPDRPETRNAMQFVSSLVSVDGKSSPLIEWMRKKNENDMEAMGKILQGNLLEAYGQIQTLRTRIASFLRKEFNTFQDLLREIRKSEEHFAQRTSGRVQPIKCNWLVNMLPEIEAAVRASIISPSEDAKEKLSKLRQVVIEPKNESYSIEIRLQPKGSLSMEELKQAFQLLDMSVTDDRHDSDYFIGRTRRNVEEIEQLSEIFGFLFASGCIAYTFHQRIVIELADLKLVLRRLRELLEEWNNQWKEIEQMPFLALFSRGYLLQLADLICRKKTEDVMSILKILLPSAASKMEVNELVQQAPSISDGMEWLSTAQIFQILRDLHTLIEGAFNERTLELVRVADPALTFLDSYGQTLKSHFNKDKAVVILNVSGELLVGCALAAYTSLTSQPIEPRQILFVTYYTDKQEVDRFMKLWSMAKFIEQDIFIIVHVERLTAVCWNAIREGVDRVLPEHRAKLLLLAQHQHRVQSTKSLGTRLGLVSDCLLDINFTADQLRQCFSKLLPKSEHLNFYTSKLPGCGKSQQAMRKAYELKPNPDYYRICIRTGTVEELLASLKSIENRNRATFLHLDVAHSVSLEFNDILLSLLMYGALYDPRKAKLGFWMMSPQTTIAVEFASPYGAEQFPIVAYLGKHHICNCDKSFFTYELAEIPPTIGKQVKVNRSDALIVAGKFLQLKQAGQEGLRIWDNLCSHPENITNNPLKEDDTFTLLVFSFERCENRNDPTFSSLNAMASFLYRHICAMIHSMWFNFSAVILFEKEDLAREFKRNIFDMLLKVANDCISRCWSVVNQGKKLTEMDWIRRQRAMFLLGRSDMDVTGMNIVGRDEEALKKMFHPTLLPILKLQRLQFQELRGFQNLMKSSEGAEVILNAIRSLLLLDGTTSSIDKVKRLDNHHRNTPASQRLHEFIGQDQGYVLTGDNITKMMFALYRIRCGLPVVVFGETGVGKTALFRFLIQTFLGHTFEVCNVNSGTTIQDVEKPVHSAITQIKENPDAQVFLFLDEMNTADHSVIAFIKELMLDRHCHGSVLPENLHLIGAANPYRDLKKKDKEAAVGLAFRFAQPDRNYNGLNADGRNLVYRVNELPLAFYEHIYDFGHLCDEAEDTYVDEICQHGLPKSAFSDNNVKWFIDIIQKSHRAARALSVDPESAVSLRDATRAVQLFCWFCQSPAGQMLSEKNPQKAADLTIYLVYAFRFRERNTFLERVFGENQSASKNMTDVSRIITQMLYKKAHGASIGSGAISLNDALCENLFALYVCILNGIFLIIVGRPGSSKSLSVEILKLVLSPGNHILRQELGDLPALTELYFQCSPMSTSSGFKALFESAQRLSVDPKMMKAMVVLDELGLADISPEKPIKVLHSELERQSFLTSGEKQQSPYSVVALSNWIVDAAQVNRGILILRTQADKRDLLESAKQLAESLVAKFANESATKRILYVLTENLESIVNIYQELDEREDIGGGYFFSMRDFFFCVKNYAAVRNFGGHNKAREVVKKIMVGNLHIPESSSLDLIVKNILDSSKPESIHIARHLMILNRSLIGLQLLNRHVKNKLDVGTSWNVLFGSCFPGDLQVTAVTRKLRQVEQAIRTGGVLVLCHADQLFESLYMVLNQQYWAQGDVTKTQIALGPSNRAIALPSGPFRIIVLQDTDVALNRELMSPAILSRFEKHELRPSHLLDVVGLNCRRAIESHPVWLAVPEEIKRQKLIYGYHEESFASLALYIQENGILREVKEDEEGDRNFENTWMRSINPMAMIKLECADSSANNFELKEVCQSYRNNFLLESLNDALQNSKSNRMVIMTNTLRHLEIIPLNSSNSQYSVIQLFEIQSELELVRRLESINGQHLNHPGFCLIVQYDAVTGPIEQFQLAKYEVEQRFQKTNCRVILIVHVDPRPVNLHWVFSFGDDWDYVFVDEVVRALEDQHQIALKELVQSPIDTPVSNFIEKISIESFKSLLFEMLGPNLQTNLVCLQSLLGQFYSGMRRALGLQDNQRLVKLLKECLLAQLKHSSIVWNIIDDVSDASFDSSSSLSNGLWGVFKQKISKSIAHLLLVSDVRLVSDQSSMKLWCDFVDANYPHRLLSPCTSDSVVQMPIGFRICTQPLGRLLASFKIAQNINEPLLWLLKHLSENEDDNSQEIKQAYFFDWLLLRIHPHLHSCLKKVPLSKMSYLVDDLFEEPDKFFLDWEDWEAKVIAALELFSIASFAKAVDNLWNDATSRMNSWEMFTKEVARLSLRTLALPDVIKSREKFIMAVSSIEVNSALMNILNSMEDLAQLLLGLRTTKRILLFNPESEVTLPKSLVSTPKQLFDNLTELVINSVIRPRVANQRNVRSAYLNTLLRSTSACSSPEELSKILGECPTHDSIVLIEENVVGANNHGVCSSCDQPLTATKEDGKRQSHLVNHLRAPNVAVIESLFRDHQKFMFLFERVAELFIEQRKNTPSDIQQFFDHLLSSDCRLRVSWRFLTVIVRTVLSTDVETKKGSEIIDELLFNIPCNRPTNELNANAYNLLLALLVCFDQDVENEPQEKPSQVFIQASMTDHWNTRRIRKLAHIRRQLAKEENGIQNIITTWSAWRKNQTNHAITNSLLFFVLRLCSHEGDQTRLGNIFRNPVIANELRHHTVINDYIKTLSPLSLGFTLQSADRTANPFQERLLEGGRFGGSFEHYPLLVNLQPDWAPFIARLAYHAFDIFEAKGISLFREMTSNLDAAAQFLFPGIENHPYLPSFTLEAFRWYVCDCGTLCCLGNCGNPVVDSVCVNCHAALGLSHDLRQGVRRATAQDFQPPRGIFVNRNPPTTPNFAVRNCSPAVTRFALLLNSLALMNAALNPHITPQVISKFLFTLPMTERQQGENRRSFIQLLSNHIVVHLDLLCQLLVISRPLTMTEKFRIGHLLLHKLLAAQNSSFLIDSREFQTRTNVREAFERGLTEMLAQQVNLAEELNQLIARHPDDASKLFRQSLMENETLHWAYARRVLANRQSVQLELARNVQLRLDYPFLNFLLDDDNGMRKLNALQHLGEALRFIALVRTVLSGEITQEEANRMSIAQGLDKIIEIVSKKEIILDRGRVVTSRDHVMSLFDGFKQLWDRFSQLENAEKKTFLDYIECQKVDINFRPNTVLDHTAPLVLICAGTEPPEAMFSCQLLNHAVEAASSIALTDFIQPHCRKDSGRVRLSCSSASALADFDESLYANVSTEKVDRFIRDHVIDRSTLPLAESFAKSAILGSAGSTVAEELYLDLIPEFKFKDDIESNNFLAILERRSLAWQPSPIPHAIQELILTDLEKSRSLAEARSVLISAITHLHHSNTEPLIISQIRNSFLSDVLGKLLESNILTESHMSDATKIALNRHLKLEVRHVFGLLKAISFRMKGDGRVPNGWTTTMSESLAQQTRAKLLAESGDGIVDTLLQLINNVATSGPVPVWLRPSESLLFAIRQLEGPEWNGIPAELKMENIEHVLRIAESLPKT